MAEEDYTKKEENRLANVTAKNQRFDKILQVMEQRLAGEAWADLSMWSHVVKGAVKVYAQDSNSA